MSNPVTQSVAIENAQIANTYIAGISPNVPPFSTPPPVYNGYKHSVEVADKISGATARREAAAAVEAQKKADEESAMRAKLTAELAAQSSGKAS